MDDLIRRYENREELTKTEIKAVATELGDWVIRCWEIEQWKEQEWQEEIERRALVKAPKSHTFFVLCGSRTAKSINTVNVLNLEAKSRKEAAMQACKRWHWSTCKVRRSDDPEIEGLKVFDLFKHSGQLLVQRNKYF